MEKLIEVWNRMPIEEKSLYSTFGKICERRGEKENMSENERKIQSFTKEKSESRRFCKVFSKIELPRMEFEYSLFIADNETANDLGILIKNRVFCVLVVEKDWELFKYPGVKGGYREILIEGTGTLKSFCKIRDFLQLQLHKGNVLLCCSTGSNKSSAAAISFLMLSFKTSYEVSKSLIPSFAKIDFSLTSHLKSYKFASICYS